MKFRTNVIVSTEGKPAPWIRASYTSIKDVEAVFKPTGYPFNKLYLFMGLGNAGENIELHLKTGTYKYAGEAKTSRTELGKYRKCRILGLVASREGLNMGYLCEETLPNGKTQIRTFLFINNGEVSKFEFAVRGLSDFHAENFAAAGLLTNGWQEHRNHPLIVNLEGVPDFPGWKSSEPKSHLYQMLTKQRELALELEAIRFEYGKFREPVPEVTDGLPRLSVPASANGSVLKSEDYRMKFVVYDLPTPAEDLPVDVTDPPEQLAKKYRDLHRKLAYLQLRIRGMVIAAEHFGDKALKVGEPKTKLQTKTTHEVAVKGGTLIRTAWTRKRTRSVTNQSE